MCVNVCAHICAPKFTCMLVDVYLCLCASVHVYVRVLFVRICNSHEGAFIRVLTCVPVRNSVRTCVHESV